MYKVGSKKKLQMPSSVKRLRDISKQSKLMMITASPVKRVIEPQALMNNSEKKDVNDMVSIFVQSTILDKYGFNGYHSEYCPRSNMLIIQKLNRLLYQCYDLKFSSLQIDDFLPKFQLHNEESLYMYYVTYKELYDLVPLAKQIFYSYNLTKITKVSDIVWMNYQNFSKFCEDIRLEINELDMMKIYYISSRTSKTITHEDNLHDWLREILIKNQDIRNDYSLTFSHFLEAIVRLSRYLWKDQNANICEQINKVHYFTLDNLAKRRIGFHIYNIIQESIFQKILHHYAKPFAEIFEKYKVNFHKGYCPDQYHTFGRMTFLDFVIFLRHSTMFIGESSTHNYKNMQDIDLSAEIAHLSLPQMNSSQLELNLPLEIKYTLLDKETEFHQMDLFKFQLWQAFECFIASQEAYGIYNLTEFLPQDERSVCIQEDEFLTCMGIFSYIKLLKMPDANKSNEDAFNEGLKVILSYSHIEYPLYQA